VLPPSTTDSHWLTAWQAAEREPVFFSEDPHVWRMLVAVWERDCIEFRYWGGSAPGAIRQVRPLSVFLRADFPGLYAEGVCETAGDKRTFRLDRVEWCRD
jgi:predicted DNA-binding transcriptional regulator YafY